MTKGAQESSFGWNTRAVSLLYAFDTASTRSLPLCLELLTSTWRSLGTYIAYRGVEYPRDPWACSPFPPLSGVSRSLFNLKTLLALACCALLLVFLFPTGDNPRVVKLGGQELVQSKRIGVAAIGEFPSLLHFRPFACFVRRWRL